MNANKDFWIDEEGQSSLLARNVALEYVAIGVNLTIGLGMLPFNIRHLGQSAYGLWVLVTSLTTYFSLLDLGYASAQVKFAARYRAKRDAQALNEITSTLFFLFSGIGLVAYVAAGVMALNLGRIFSLAPAQIQMGRSVLLITSLYLAAGFPFSVFGGIVNGFQRYYRNNIIAIVTSVLVAVVNVIVLRMGYGIVELVALTTLIRLGSFGFYRRSAYLAFPLLRIRPALVSFGRLREITGFSIFLLLIDIAGKINFSADMMVIGAFMTTSAIAIWAVAIRVVDIPALLTGALTRFIFPTVVDSATNDRMDRLRLLLVQGTRLCLAMVVPLTCVISILARPAVLSYVGPKFAGSVPIIWILSGVVLTRVGTTTSSTILKGTERHQFLAYYSLAVAVLNLALSCLMVRPWGLVGVAIGTLIPVAGISWGILFPAACRRLGLGVGHVIRRAVWPPVWPMIPTGALLIAARPFVSGSLPLIFCAAVAAGLVYAAIFLSAALGPADREWYIERARIVSRGALPIAT
jgi:O-antigen/teichoic acid export membrane protein